MLCFVACYMFVVLLFFLLRKKKHFDDDAFKNIIDKFKRIIFFISVTFSVGENVHLHV